LVWRSGQPFIEGRAPALRLPQLAAKRTVDLLVASLLLVIVAPLLIAIAVWIWAESGGPVLFRQRRLGLHGFPFMCLKFRSMFRDAEDRLREDPVLWSEYVRGDFKLPADRDTRITRVGRFLRRTSLDELPQLWNVIRGDMSLVGPRPIVPEELTHYSDVERVFLSLKPGLTGAWQVGGRSSLAYPQRAAVELDYIENWSLATDLMILIRTIPSVLAARGAH
jgi:lipopolysaccharide/colanic/teichoic acid biosynthesis glycosyltransferase